MYTIHCSFTDKKFATIYDIWFSENYINVRLDSLSFIEWLEKNGAIVLRSSASRFTPLTGISFKDEKKYLVFLLKHS